MLENNQSRCSSCSCNEVNYGDHSYEVDQLSSISDIFTSLPGVSLNTSRRREAVTGLDYDVPLNLVAILCIKC